MALNLNAVQSAIVTSLPVRARWMINEMSADHDFSVGHQELHELPSDIARSGDKTWLNLLIFGDCDYSQGGGAHPWLGVRKTDGAVYGLDLEREVAAFVLNSSINGFIRTFDCLNEYFGKGKPVPLDLGARLQAIDPDVYPASDWRFLVEYVTDV